MPPGNWAAGERGITGLPGREQEFRDGVEKALKYAEHLGVSRLHAMAGIAPAGADLAACRATLIANLKHAAQKLVARNLTLLIEAINTRDIPGFLVTTQEESHAVLDAVCAPNFKMQMDLYHMQVRFQGREVGMREGEGESGVGGQSVEIARHNIAGFQST